MYRNTKGRFISKRTRNKPIKFAVITYAIVTALALIFSIPDLVNYAKAESPIPPEIVQTLAPLGLAHQIDTLSQQYHVNRVTAEKIIYCESRFKEDAIHHNTDGSSDISYWQINVGTWYSVLKKHDLSPDSLEAGFWIMANYGTFPWGSSKHCWQ